MALSGLEIFKLLPRTNCGDCGVPTCMAFAMRLAQKKAELGDLSGRPARSLIDEILAPVDRDVFRREVGYFETLSEEIQGSAAQGEKPVTPETARP